MDYCLSHLTFYKKNESSLKKNCGISYAYIPKKKLGKHLSTTCTVSIIDVYSHHSF